jgi:hypothetical protein
MKDWKGWISGKNKSTATLFVVHSSWSCGSIGALSVQNLQFVEPLCLSLELHIWSGSVSDSTWNYVKG